MKLGSAFVSACVVRAYVCQCLPIPSVYVSQSSGFSAYIRAACSVMCWFDVRR